MIDGMPSDTFPTVKKDPGSHEDFTVDWTEYLNPTGDSIDEIVSVTIDPVKTGGISVLAPPTPPGGAALQISGKKTVAWLTGGVEGRQYLVTHRILTVQGRTAEQTVRVKVEHL